MNRSEDPFIALVAETLADGLASPAQHAESPIHRAGRPGTMETLAPAVGRLHGFDLLDQALIAGLKAWPGQVLTARSTVPLAVAMIGREVLLLFEGGNLRAPIIVGVIESRAQMGVPPATEPGMSIQADGKRYVIDAEREIILRCGDASITLTRAGKVIIKGHYILSRSTGYNKIKGGAIDIN